MSFEATRPQTLPVWLSGATGKAYEAGVGAVEDTTLLGLKEAAKIRWPLEGCIDPSDDAALEAQAQNRQIERMPTEAGLAFRDRLAGAHNLAYWRGTRSAYYNIFEPYKPSAHTQCTAELIRDANGEEFLAQTASSSDWIQVYGNHDVGGYWDGNSEEFSRVFVHIDSHLPGDPFTTDGLWDDPGVWDDGRLWDCNITELDARYIRYEIRRTKALPAYPVTIAFWLHDITNGLQFPLDGFWFSPGNWDDPGVWDDEVAQDPVFLTIGNVWHQEAGLGGWLGLASPQLYDIWTDGSGVWEGFVPP